MNTPTPSDRTCRALAGRLASFAVTVWVLAVAFGWSTGSLYAQTPTAAEGDSAAKAPDLSANLAGVEGVESGMSPERLLEVGRKALEQGRLADSRKILLALAAHDRTNLAVMSHLAFVYERSAEQIRGDGSNPEAVAQANRYLDQMVDVYLEAAALAMRQNKMRVAEQMYGRLLILRPEASQALLGLARIYAATDRMIQAIDRYQSYLVSPIGREDSDAYLELGKLYLRDNHWRQALDALYRASRLSPENADIQDALARSYQKGNRLDDALEAARLATEKAPREAKYRATLAELKIVSRDAEQASLEARRAIEYTREKLRESSDDMKLLEALSGYYEIYERALEAHLATGKASLAVRVDLARSIQEHAMVDRARSLHKALLVLTNAPPENKDDVRLMETLAEVQFNLGRTETSAETCKRLLKQDPNNVIAKRVLSEIEAAKAP